jgi:hypothetical protein
VLISSDRQRVVSNLGWVDKSALWTYDVTNDRIVSLPLGGAKYLSIFPCKDPGQFAVLHHSGGLSIRLTIHSFDNPALPLCMIERAGNISAVEGDVTALGGAPRYYVAYYDPGDAGDYHLVFIDRGQEEIQIQRFDWYDYSYDKMYQAITGVIELPSGNLVISIQRDSNPVLYDPAAKRVVKKLSLAGRAGNPTLRLAALRREIWADDYDTILKLDVDSLRIRGSRRLQTSADGTAHFIGQWSFDEKEALCLVPRPFSGDVVGISMDDLKTRSVAKLGRQPLEAALLKDGLVIGRDWKTGELLKGSLRRKWFE